MSTVARNKISEADVVNFIDSIKQFPSIFSEPCDITDIVFPFLCQYIYPPCDNNNASAARLISSRQCEAIRDQVCPTQWKLVEAMSSPLSSMLPVCENFEDTDIDNSNNLQNMHTSQPLQCHYQFKEFCNLCIPLCGKFSQYKDKTRLQEKSVLIFSGIFATIGGILVFIVAVVRKKKM